MSTELTADLDASLLSSFTRASSLTGPPLPFSVFITPTVSMVSVSEYYTLIVL